MKCKNVNGVSNITFPYSCSYDSFLSLCDEGHNPELLPHNLGTPSINSPIITFSMGVKRAKLITHKYLVSRLKM
jgi:hypothetical protein